MSLSARRMARSKRLSPRRRFRSVISLVKSGRTGRSSAQDLGLRVELEAEAGLQQQKRRRGRPRLRRAGDRIERRALRRAAAESRRTAPAGAAARCRPARVEQALEDARRLALEAVAREAQRRSGRCRAARPSRCDRTSDCSAPRPRRRCGRPSPRTTCGVISVADDRARALGQGDAGEQGVAGIRGRAPGTAAWRRRARARRCRVASNQKASSNARPQRLGLACVSAVARSRRGRARPAMRAGRALGARRRRPAPRTSAIGPSASVPSAWKIESWLSFQPWLRRPFVACRRHIRRSRRRRGRHSRRSSASAASMLRPELSRRSRRSPVRSR